MSNKPSYEQLENRISELANENRKLNKLYEAATAINSDLSLEKTIKSIASHIAKVLDSTGCAILFWLRDKNQLETLIDYNPFYPEKVDKPGRTYDLDNHPSTLHALETNQTYHVRIDDPEADELEIAFMKTQRVFDSLLLPLTVGKQTLGLLELYDDVELKKFTEHEIRLAEALTFQAAIALKNAQLYGAAQTEINNRKRAEEALLESEERYRTIFNTAPVSIILLDKEGQMVDINLFYITQMGKGQTSKEDYIGVNLITHPSIVNAGLSETYRKVLEGKPFEQTDVYFPNSTGGTDGCFSVKGTPYYIDGKIVGAVTTHEDVTERIRAEETLRKAHDELETRVEERTAELSKANEELLKEHNQRKVLSKRLIGLLEKDRHDVAMELHDSIGQILTSLKLNLEMMNYRFKHIDTELEAMIKAAEKRTIQVIRDIKNISRGLMPGILDALGLLPSLRELFNEVQERRDIKIIFFNQNVPKRFDQAKELAIYRIVQEALNNIVKHAEAKNVFVNLLKKGNAISLSVEDDGIGFDQEEAMIISKGKGSLGLIIMRERAIQLDGELTVESQVGSGTNLLMEVPIKDSRTKG